MNVTEIPEFSTHLLHPVVGLSHAQEEKFRKPCQEQKENNLVQNAEKRVDEVVEFKSLEIISLVLY